MLEKDSAEIRRQVYQRAKRRVWSRIGWAWHVTLYLFVNAAMLAINLRYSPDTLWFVWPAGAWGFALALHTLAVFMSSSNMSRDMLEAEIQRELERRGLV